SQDDARGFGLRMEAPTHTWDFHRRDVCLLFACQCHGTVTQRAPANRPGTRSCFLSLLCQRNFKRLARISSRFSKSMSPPDIQRGTYGLKARACRGIGVTAILSRAQTRPFVESICSPIAPDSPDV